MVRVRAMEVVSKRSLKDLYIELQELFSGTLA